MLVLPISSISNPNLSHSTLLFSKNAILDLTPVATITSSHGTSSPLFNDNDTGLLFSSTLSFTALTPNFKFTPFSSNLFL